MKLRKTIALLLTALLLFASAVPAFAAGTGDEISVAEAAARVGAHKRAADAVAAHGSALQTAYDPEETVTVVVELNPAAGMQAYGAGQSGSPAQALRSSVKQKVALLDSEPFAGAGNRPASANGIRRTNVEFLFDYDVLLQGFSMKIKAKYLSDVRAIEGVKTAFVARTYHKTAANGAGGTHENDVSQNFAGAEAARAAGITGAGQLIAVLDSGIDVEHEAFGGKNVSVPSPRYTPATLKQLFTAEALQAETDGATAATVYYSAKLPFVFDYTDGDTSVEDTLVHGTHVAGIAAAVETETMIGMAPDAQIAFMKVFDDDTGYADDAYIFAALEDAALLGADVVNLSLGSDAGFSTYEDETAARVYENLREKGINVDASAGNSGFAPGDGEQPATDTPTYGIVGDPSTYEAALSVASVDRYYSDSLTAGGKILDYNLGTCGTDELDLQTLTAADLPARTLAYVDCGFGAGSDFRGKNLSGKLALVSRGGEDEETGELLTFGMKAESAAAAGAVGIIVYNNVGGPLISPMAVFEAESHVIPLFFVSDKDGAYLLGLADKTVAFGDMDRLVSRPSDFSSWGPTSDLKLKPEIAAAGGNVYSATPGNNYTEFSGTSMAAPQLSGVTALLRQYLAGKNYNTGLSTDLLVDTLLMNTAVPMQTEKGWYSPMKQGAGMASIENAMNAKAFITVEGSALPKAELGDGIDREGKTVTFTVHNLTNEQLSYKVSTLGLAQVADVREDGVYFEEFSKSFSGKGVSARYKGNVASDCTVTVPANGTATVKATISTTAAFADYAEEIGAENGLFLDGYIRLTAKSGSGSNLVIPFLSFWGDWSQVPLFGENTVWSGDDFNIPLGANPFVYSGDPDDPFVIVPEKSAISPTSAYFCNFITATDLQKNGDLSFTLEKANGQVVSTRDMPLARRTIFLPDYGSYLYPELNVETEEELQIVTAQDNALSPGRYTYTVKATSVDGAEQSYSFGFLVDNVAPALEYSFSGDGKTLYVTVNDNASISAIALFGAMDQETDELFVTDIEGIADSSGDFYTVDQTGEATYVITVDLKGMLAQMYAEGRDVRHVAVAAYDYALNESTAVIDMRHEASGDVVPCNYCGRIHTGFFGKITQFFHDIFYFFKTLFRR